MRNLRSRSLHRSISQLCSAANRQLRTHYPDIPGNQPDDRIRLRPIARYPVVSSDLRLSVTQRTSETRTMPDRSPRRLTAIVAADVVGYSRLMSEDESGTLSLLQKHRAEVFDPEGAKHGGRIVKLMGDGALVEFPSVVDAVEAAMEIQQKVAETGSQIQLRFGVNLGDVVDDGAISMVTV